MKKIGIITFHKAHNYGAMLQAYALQKTLKKMNSEVYIIDYRDDYVLNNYYLFKMKIRGEKPKNILKKIIKNVIFFNKKYKRYRNFEKFVKKYYNLSKKYKSEEKLKRDYPLYDIYITGSDQVWNTNITDGLKDAYTLNFGTDSTKRISYAASIGNNDIDEKYKKVYKEKLSKLDKISVREENAKKALEKIISKEIKVVLDPTMLLTSKEWEEIIQFEKEEKEEYILSYVVEDNMEHQKIVNYLSEKTGLKVIHFEPKNNKYKNILKNANNVGPLQFVKLIKDAKYIVATSFHATIFSILFRKKFFIVPHVKTGTRVTNLLEKLSITDRTYEKFEEFKRIDYDFETDYDKVNKILKEERKKSLEFLNNVIEEKN